MKKAGLVLAVAGLALSMVSMDVVACKNGKSDNGQKKDGGTSVVGILSLTRGNNGDAIGATITGKSGTVYNIVMSGLTEDLAPLNGKRVHATGVVKDVDGKTMLKVTGEIKLAKEHKQNAATGSTTQKTNP
jgi:hypothetical protein